MRSQTQSRLLFLHRNWKKTGSSSGEIKLKKKDPLSFPSAPESRPFLHTQSGVSVNGKQVVLRPELRRTAAKNWVTFFFVSFFFNATVQFLFSDPDYQLVPAFDPGPQGRDGHSSRLILCVELMCIEKKMKRLDSRQDGVLLRRYSVQCLRRRDSNNLAQAASLI